MGNICQINENGKLLVRYTYDGLNRLIREDNAKFGKTYLFDYDGTGNITSKRECTFALDIKKYKPNLFKIMREVAKSNLSFAFCTNLTLILKY